MLREPARWKRALRGVARASCLRVRAASLPPDAGFQRDANRELTRMNAKLWSAVARRRFRRLAGSPVKQSRVQRLAGPIERALEFDGDKSPAESAAKSAHSKAWGVMPTGCGRSSRRRVGKHLRSNLCENIGGCRADHAIIIGKRLKQQRQTRVRSFGPHHQADVIDDAPTIGLIRISQCGFKDRKRRPPEAGKRRHGTACSSWSRIVFHQSFQFRQRSERVGAKYPESSVRVACSLPCRSINPFLKRIVVPNPARQVAAKSFPPRRRFMPDPFHKIRQCIRADVKHRLACLLKFRCLLEVNVVSVDGEPFGERAALVVRFVGRLQDEERYHQQHRQPQQNENPSAFPHGRSLPPNDVFAEQNPCPSVSIRG